MGPSWCRHAGGDARPGREQTRAGADRQGAQGRTALSAGRACAGRQSGRATASRSSGRQRRRRAIRVSPASAEGKAKRSTAFWTAAAGGASAPLSNDARGADTRLSAIALVVRCRRGRYRRATRSRAWRCGFCTVVSPVITSLSTACAHSDLAIDSQTSVFILDRQGSCPAIHGLFEMPWGSSAGGRCA